MRSRSAATVDTGWSVTGRLLEPHGPDFGLQPQQYPASPCCQWPTVRPAGSGPSISRCRAPRCPPPPRCPAPNSGRLQSQCTATREPYAGFKHHLREEQAVRVARFHGKAHNLNVTRDSMAPHCQQAAISELIPETSAWSQQRTSGDPCSLRSLLPGLYRVFGV